MLALLLLNPDAVPLILIIFVDFRLLHSCFDDHLLVIHLSDGLVGSPFNVIIDSLSQLLEIFILLERLEVEIY